MVALEKTLNVIVNGSPMELPSGITIAELLRLLEIDSMMVAVERNLEIVPKRNFPSIPVSAGDRIEIVHFVGGG